MAGDSCRDFHTSVFFANQTTNQLNYEINKYDFKLQNWSGIIATGAEIYSRITRCQCPRIGT